MKTSSRIEYFIKKILWQDLKFYSYKMKGGLGTENVGLQKRVNFAVRMQELFNCNPSAILLMEWWSPFHRLTGAKTSVTGPLRIHVGIVHCFPLSEEYCLVHFGVITLFWGRFHSQRYIQILKTFKDQNCRGQISYMETDTSNRVVPRRTLPLQRWLFWETCFLDRWRNIIMFPGQQNSRLVT